MKYVFLAFFLCGCGYPGAQSVPDSPNLYTLPYCQDERDCFNSAKNTCPNGYEVTTWSSANKPTQFRCL